MLDSQTDDITAAELAVLEYWVRWDAAMAALGIDPTTLRVLRYLMVAGGGYNQSDLAYVLDIQRSTFRDRIRHLHTTGVVETKNRLIYITTAGRLRFIEVFRQTHAIAQGEARGYSDDVISMVENSTRRNVHRDRAANLSTLLGPRPQKNYGEFRHCAILSQE